MTTQIDLHTQNAAKLFKVVIKEVTNQQRAAAKKWAYARDYLAGEIKQSLLVGQYPIKVENDK